MKHVKGERLTRLKLLSLIGAKLTLWRSGGLRSVRFALARCIRLLHFAKDECAHG